MSEELRRPAIPHVTWFAVALWAGAAAGERWLCDAPNNLWLVAGLLAALSLGAGFAAMRSRLLAALMIAGLVAGIAISGLEWAAVQRYRQTATECRLSDWRGTVEADPMPGQFGGVVRVRVRGGPLEGARVRVSWPEGAQLPALGRLVRFSAILKPLPLEEAWARRMQRGGICASGSAWHVETGSWQPGVIGRLYAWRARTLCAVHELSGPGADLAEGIVLGDRRRLLGTPAEQDFQVLGLTHLVAVSGSHLALACGAVGFIGVLLRVPKRVLVPATICAGAAYAIVTGLPFSALRSLLMLLVVGMGQLLGRRGSGLASLSVAVVAVLALEPWSVYDLGLQLSVLAVASLLLFGSLASAWMRAGMPQALGMLGEPLGLTLIAQVATVPVVASAFGMVSVLAPIANALAGALVSVALLLGLSGAVALSVVRPLGMVLFKCCCAVLGIAAWGAHAMAQVPGAAVAMNGGLLLTVITAVGLTALWVKWPLPSGRSVGMRAVTGVVALSLALAFGPPAPQHCVITVLDVGQGDAILVQDGGRTMLVDAGPDQLSMRQALARTGVRAIDVLVLTHAHDDHIGGLGALPSVAEIGWIGAPVSSSAATIPSAETRLLRMGDTWRIGDAQVRVLWPPTDGVEELETNDTSVVLEVRHGAFTAVLTGDAEGVAQEGMLGASEVHDIDVLKVPHHGSSNGLIAESLAAWTPELALISVGTGNDFGHPSASTLELLRTSRTRVLRTDQVGDIVILVSERGYRVNCTRDEGVHARMGTGSQQYVCRSMRADWHQSRGTCGTRRDHRGSEAGLSDLRRRGAAGRTRAPPPSRPGGTGCRPRLQLRVVRR